MKKSLAVLAFLLCAVSVRAEEAAGPMTEAVDAVDAVDAADAANALAYRCFAVDYGRYSYWYTAYNLRRAQRGAMNTCFYYSRYGGCRLWRCERVWVR